MKTEYLKLYKHECLWCFDHKPMGIVCEPFVEGIDEIIEAVASRNFGIPKRKLPSELILSWTTDDLWPRNILVHVSGEDRSGEPWNRYELRSTNIPLLEGNLCPVLLQFFATPPEFIRFEIHRVTSELLEFCA